MENPPSSEPYSHCEYLVIAEVNSSLKCDGDKPYWTDASFPQDCDLKGKQAWALDPHRRLVSYQKPTGRAVLVRRTITVTDEVIEELS